MKEKNKFDKDYFSTLTDEEKERYLYNIICYGVATEKEVEEADV